MLDSYAFQKGSSGDIDLTMRPGIMSASKTAPVDRTLHFLTPGASVVVAMVVVSPFMSVWR